MADVSIEAQFLALYLQDGAEMITIISAVKVDKYDRYQTRFGTFVTVGAMQQWKKKKQRETFAAKIWSFVDQFKGLFGVGLRVDLGVHAKFPLFRSIILSFNPVSVPERILSVVVEQDRSEMFLQMFTLMLHAADDNDDWERHYHYVDAAADASTRVVSL